MMEPKTLQNSFPILFCAATEKELKAAFLGLSQFSKSELQKGVVISSNHFLITGVGIASSILNLMDYLFKNSEISGVVNLGVCGAYPGSNLQIGSVFRVVQECIVDLGTYGSNDEFQNLQQMGFASSTVFSCKSDINRFPKEISEFWQELPVACGATVNSCTHTEEQAKQRSSLAKASVESMEGAAVLMTCLRQNIPLIQIRSISNYATARKDACWNLEKALQSLNPIFEHIDSTMH